MVILYLPFFLCFCLSAALPYCCNTFVVTLTDASQQSSEKNTRALAVKDREREKRLPSQCRESVQFDDINNNK